MAKKRAPSRQPNVISDYDPIAAFEREPGGRLFTPPRRPRRTAAPPNKEPTFREKGAAKAKPRKPTTPAEKPKNTQRTRLISLMQEIGLAKSGLLLHEVREKVRPQFQKKHYAAGRSWSSGDQG